MLHNALAQHTENTRCTPLPTARAQHLRQAVGARLGLEVQRALAGVGDQSARRRDERRRRLGLAVLLLRHAHLRVFHSVGIWTDGGGGV